MTAKIVTVICGIAITVGALVALNWQRAQPTPGELQARDVSAAAQAAVDVAAARARAAELPGREMAVTVGLWAVVMAGAIVAIGGGLAVVRAAHVRAGFVPVDLQHPQALVSPAGVMVLSGRQAETAPQAIAPPVTAPMTPCRNVRVSRPQAPRSSAPMEPLQSPVGLVQPGARTTRPRRPAQQAPVGVPMAPQPTPNDAKRTSPRPAPTQAPRAPL